MITLGSPHRTAAVAAALVSVLLTGAAGTAGAQPDPPVPITTSATPTSTPFRTPDTDSCPNRTQPPRAIDASEIPTPGQPKPQPLPVPDQPVGGTMLGRCGTIVPAGAPALPKDISATSWVVADLDTGNVLAAKDPHGRYRPASTIKTLLAIVALRELDLSRVVTGTAEDAAVDGTRVGIGPGGQYSNDQLMHALLMASGNDAANVIARELGGVDATLRKMNAQARTLGALDTRAATPAGLDGPGMSSSAYDLALIFRTAMQLPRFEQIIHTEQIDFPGFPKDPRIPEDIDHPGFAIGNDNQLLYNYDGAIGGKTGYTDDARHTFLAGAERGGRRLVVALMQADVLPIRPWEQGARLLDYGFALPRDASVGTLAATAEPAAPESRAAQPQPIAEPGTIAPTAIAAPAGTASPTLPHWPLRIGLILGGLLAIVLLLLTASMLHDRRR
ncbi:D-alanyl-D-alanine carboxypeptidase family protein [Skermania piniformis]|uniref:D-alanyl-D-alanine carboxypeptidase n=1 Tax=Skermania pinensis TaxID=39122 RepID=A0ABX8S8Q0_9ACTN|nr:D-alanyl-D-alanine carboxypeptidase family protein [Skermania piniformis]QXQ13367.1 D-alanyl-D-alanine carboxypeptidase [Skermania piniformis]